MKNERVIDRAERLRIAAKLGKEEMASRIGVTLKTYNRHLSGETEAGNLKTFMRITSACEKLETEISENTRDDTATQSGTKASTKTSRAGKADNLPPASL